VTFEHERAGRRCLSGLAGYCTAVWYRLDYAPFGTRRRGRYEVPRSRWCSLEAGARMGGAAPQLTSAAQNKPPMVLCTGLAAEFYQTLGIPNSVAASGSACDRLAWMSLLMAEGRAMFSRNRGILGAVCGSTFQRCKYAMARV